jgi:hypothetical protein
MDDIAFEQQYDEQYNLLQGIINEGRELLHSLEN